MVAGDEWLPGRLSSLHPALVESGSRWVHDCARDEQPEAARRHASRQATHERLLAGHRQTWEPWWSRASWRWPWVGSTCRCAAARFSTSRCVSMRTSGGVRTPPGSDAGAHGRRELRQCLADCARSSVRGPGLREMWSSTTTWSTGRVGGRAADPDLVSVLIPTSGDWEMTRAAVASLDDAREAGTPHRGHRDRQRFRLVTAATLAALPHEFDDVRVRPQPGQPGFALGNNLAMAEAGGPTVVFLNNDTEVQPGWLTPLRRAFEGEGCWASSRCCSTPREWCSQQASCSRAVPGYRTRCYRVSRRGRGGARGRRCCTP